MSNATISIISIGLLDLAMMGLWLAIYFNRKRLVRWICLHKKSRGQLEAIETILAEALKEHYITYQQDKKKGNLIARPGTRCRDVKCHPPINLQRLVTPNNKPE